MHRSVPFPVGSSWLAACFFVVIAALGCGKEDSAGMQPASQAVASGGRATGAGGERLAPVPTPPRYASAPKADQPVVTLTTSLGPIVIRLDPEAAPVSVQNFLNYVASGHYNQTVFHYVEQGKLILGGGYLEDGTAKPAGLPIRCEADNGRQNVQGTIAMARDAAVIDSAASQFFINIEDAPHLDHAGDSPAEFGYCVFGEVIEGLDIARQIAAIPSETQVIDGVETSVPAKTVRIESANELLR